MTVRKKLTALRRSLFATSMGLIPAFLHSSSMIFFMLFRSLDSPAP
jgi:hypothetical protein